MADKIKDPKVAKIFSDFERARSMRIHFERLWYELDKFDRGEQWIDATKPAWVPTPVTNYIHLVKSMKQASMALHSPIGELRPLSPDDVDAVDTLQKVYEYEFRKGHVRDLLGDCIGTAVLLGTAIAQVSWKEDTGVLGGTNMLYEGDLEFKEIDPLTMAA